MIWVLLFVLLGRCMGGVIAGIAWLVLVLLFLQYVVAPVLLFFGLVEAPHHHLLGASHVR
jgi:hypothetical protein